MLDGLAFLHCLHVFLLFSSGFVSTNPETLLSQGLQVQTLKPWPLTRLSVTGNSVYGAALDGTNPARHRLEACYVFCLQTLRTLLHFEFHRLTLIQGLVTVHHDGGEVHENIFSRLALDESISLRSVKPLHRSLFLHRVSLAYLIKLRASLGPCFTSCPVASGNLYDFRRATSPDLRRDTLRTQKKDCKFVLAAPLNESKGITRATNATVRLTQNGCIV